MERVSGQRQTSYRLVAVIQAFPIYACSLYPKVCKVKVVLRIQRLPYLDFKRFNNPIACLGDTTRESSRVIRTIAPQFLD
ncbi:hypothetical protein D3C77_278800 [compost metagenome]